jgi:hypothetical protein
MAGPLDAARAAFADRDPVLAAKACGFEYVGSSTRGEFGGRLLGKAISLRYPEFDAVWLESGTPVLQHLTALAVYYLAVSDGSPPNGEWISFAQLPEGGFYVTAWRGYTPDALVRHFDDRIEALCAATAALHGDPLGLPGDLAIGFEVLPRLPLGLVYWCADEEFPARADVLFDETASHHLPTDCCAILSKQLVVALIAADSGQQAPA